MAVNIDLWFDFVESLLVLLYSLVHDVRTSTWCHLSCVATGMGIGVSVLEVSCTAELFPGEGVPQASGIVTGVCGAAVLLTQVSGTGVVGMGVGGNVGPHIPWLFFEGLPDPNVWLMLVARLCIYLHNARLCIYLHNAMLSVDVNYHGSALGRASMSSILWGNREDWAVSGVPIPLRIIRVKLLWLLCDSSIVFAI